MTSARPARGLGRCSKGVALLMVLWLIVLMSVLAVGSIRVVGAETRSLSTHLDRAEARAVAEAGLNRAILDLRASGSSRRWRADGTAETFQFAGKTMLVSIRPTKGLVDLNRADESLMKGVLGIAGIGEQLRDQLAAAVLDWRDPDDFVRLHGAEAADYAIDGLEWGPRNAPFESVEELRYVYGMTAEIYSAVAPYLTIYSGRSGIELGYAPTELVEALTGRQIVEDEVPPATPATRARGTFHVTVEVPIGTGATLEVAADVRIGSEQGPCCRILSQRERTRPFDERKRMNAI